MFLRQAFKAKKEREREREGLFSREEEVEEETRGVVSGMRERERVPLTLIFAHVYFLLLRCYCAAALQLLLRRERGPATFLPLRRARPAAVRFCALAMVRAHAHAHAPPPLCRWWCYSADGARASSFARDPLSRAPAPAPRAHTLTHTQRAVFCFAPLLFLWVRGEWFGGGGDRLPPSLSLHISGVGCSLTTMMTVMTTMMGLPATQTHTHTHIDGKQPCTPFFLAEAPRAAPAAAVVCASLSGVFFFSCARRRHTRTLHTYNTNICELL